MACSTRACAMAVSPVDLAVGAEPRPRSGAWTTLGRFVRKKPLGAAGGVLVLVMVLTAVFSEVLQTHDPIPTSAAYTPGSPSAVHGLGTEHLGRDIYSTILQGAPV